jgi:hypothetical protein
MATLMNTGNAKTWTIVHPLDDTPEVKRNTEAMGPMAMSSSVKLSLCALQGYLVLMLVLVVYHVFGLATAAAHGVR